MADTGIMGNDSYDDPCHDPVRCPQPEDVLDRLQQMEGQFDRVKEGLAHLQRLATLGTLAATLVHELNNLLTPVISYSQMALTRPEDVELSRKAHEKALAGAQRAAGLCVSMLGYSREDQDQAAPRANLRAGVESALCCLARGLDKDGIELALDLPEIDVAMAPASLEQVLVNLVLNARKAMAERGGRLTLRARQVQSMAYLDITDTGRGVPREVADRLFEPFVTCAISPGDHAERGTGLGLSVCRDLITAVGGQVSFDSTPGQGTTFHLSIPLAQQLRRSA